MFIEMPFQHRLRAGTSRTSEPRELAAWDSELLELEELPRGDFDEGAELGNVATIVKDGFHWARLMGDVYEHRVHETALHGLVREIGPSRFFTDPDRKIAQTSIMAKTPDFKSIVHSERSANVAGLVAWTEENLVAVDGQIFTRVKEPVVSLDICGPFDGEQCFVTLALRSLKPLDSDTDYGIMATIGEARDLIGLAKRRMADDPRLYRFDSKITGRELAAMSNTTENPVDVAERTLMAMARRLTSGNNRKMLNAEMVKSLLGILRQPGCDADPACVSRVAAALERFRPAMDYKYATLAEIALDRWSDNPINVDAVAVLPSRRPR